jgi:hypothetical protein
MKNRKVWIIGAAVIIVMCCCCLIGSVVAYNYRDVLLGGSINSNSITGEVLFDNKDVNLTGTIQLVDQKPDANKDSKATVVPIMESKITSSNHKFTFANVKPGRYYLEVTITLSPCFLGRPGTSFGGMMISFYDNWNPIGLSFKDGSSLITGTTNELVVEEGKSLEVKLKVPDCY